MNGDDDDDDDDDDDILNPAVEGGRLLNPGCGGMGGGIEGGKGLNPGGVANGGWFICSGGEGGLNDEGC